MTMADADKMLEWKNYPETRKFAIASHALIKKADHYKWLEKNIQHFQIIEGIEKEKMGAVRIENQEISIWIDNEYWGKGIASFVLEMIYEDEMFAKIVDGNIASMRAFIKAGFKPYTYNITNYRLNSNYYIFKR